jgi:hypothetical protein
MQESVAILRQLEIILHARTTNFLNKFHNSAKSQQNTSFYLSIFFVPSLFLKILQLFEDYFQIF